MSKTSTPTSLSTALAMAVFASMAAVYFLSYFQRTAVPGTIFNELQMDLGLSASAVALMGSMFTWIYGGMQIAVGFLVDRYGGIRVFLCGGLIMLAGATWFPLATSADALFAARAITGLGSSFMYLCIIKELGHLFGHRHFTLWLGILLAAGYCGGITATLPFERACAAFGWRHVLLAVAALTFVALLISGLVLRRSGFETRTAQPPSLTALKSIFGQRRCWPLLASSPIAFPLLFVIQTVLGKKFLQDFGGLSSQMAASFILVMATISTVGVTLGGLLPRRLGRRRKPWLLTGALVLLVAIGCLLSGTLLHVSGRVLLVGYILLACSSIAVPSSISTMKELNRADSMALAISVINGLSYVGSGLIGHACGWILGRYQDAATVTADGVIYPVAAYVALCGFLTALAGLNLLFVCLIPETRSEALAPETPPVNSATA